ncbi:TonB-dependent receptor [Janthinobacterium sp. PSPC3-1]|uniref:TonB-dependent receptor n=1 Tax=Janthinobacterium sp. PSPC3-1 TaxID=2804653 RepID=UPI003CF4ED50
MLREKVLVRALALAFSAGAMSTMIVAPVMAQSNAAGTIFGTVDAPAGASVTLLNLDTGLKRTTNVDATGRYTVTALPIGRYKVELLRDGKIVDSKEADVVIGQGVDASFGSQVQAVQVTGRRNRIDVSNTNNGAIFTAKELDKLPVATNLSSIILLAPNTTRADSAYGGTSIGGGGASENAFYVNGFPVTNPLTQLGSSELPFGAIAQAQVLTGGFGAEFGRSIGGVLNVTTKSGTNNWEFGATAAITPNKLRSDAKNIYYPNTGVNPDTDGALHFRRDTSKSTQNYYGAYVGGPIIQDKLFMFVAVDQTATKTGIGASTASTTLERDGWADRHVEQTRYLAKFDWNITDNHRLEWTSIGDTTKDRQRNYGLNVDSYTSNGVKYSEQNDKNGGGNGAESNALKYTGQFTDDLVFTTLYGISKAPRSTTYEDYDVNGILRSVTSTVAGRVPELDARNLYRNYQKYSGATGNITKPGSDEVKSFRADLEYKLGNHTLRVGVDHNEIDSVNAGQFRAGGGSWSYRTVGEANAFRPVNLSGGRPGVVGNFNGYGTRGYYVRLSDFSSVTDASATQSAQYLEDRYQVTKNLLITAGIRNEQYTNRNGDGEKFIDVKNQIAPRLAASWDVNGDASLKVFGSAGRYHLQLPTQVAARAASRSTLITQDFTYTGIDERGQPLGLVAINTPVSPDNEYGQRKDVRSVVVKDLKPNYQDEVTLGFEKAFNPSFNFGAKATYRKLGAGIDDSCDTRPLRAYAAKNGIAVEATDIPCFIFNPGEEATVWLNGTDGTGRYVTLSKEELGFPKVKRTYAAVDLFAEHPFRNGWYGKINYTWSRSYGNMEGQTRSDTGQTDVGTSAGWDFPEFTPDSMGLLPNDRRHQLKAFGYYEFTNEWSVGGNLLIQSGRPKTCLGTNPVADAGEDNPYGGPGYGAEYYFCGGVPTPRGSLGRMPVEKRLDLNVAYKPAILKGVEFKIDVFNVTNSQTATARQETYDDGSGEGILANYNENRTLQAPRTVKLSVEYNHKF